MKTIWILNHYAIPPELGPLTRHYKFGEKLIQRGYRVKIFASSALHYVNKNMIVGHEDFAEKNYNGVPFVFVKTMEYKGNGKKRMWNMLQYFNRVIKVGKKEKTEKPDVIYASSAHPLTWFAGYILSRRFNATFIAETRDLWPETLVKMNVLNRNHLPAKMLYKLEKFIYTKADKLIFTFPGGADYVKELGINPSKVHYINNGVDLEQFYKDAKENNFQDSLLDTKDFFKVVYTGSIGKPNAVHNLLYAAKTLKEKKYDGIKIFIFGEGSEKEILESYKNKYELDNVIFYGRIQKDKIPSILMKSDLNIITGISSDLYQYGLSLNKMFEYFAAGKPILSNIVSGYDLLEKYNSGVTIMGDNPDLLADSIVNFYEMDSEKYSWYCQNSIIASKDFDFEILTDKLERLF